MQKITPWIVDAKYGCAYRHIVGADPEDITQRVALIEKSPRVRIRPAWLRVSKSRYEDGCEYIVEHWAEHLDWCYGSKGDGHDDEESRAWCDAMLKALGYKEENAKP